MNIVAIIQARIGSVRMPKKVLARIGNETIITFLHKRIKSSKLLKKIVFAIPDTKENDALYNYLTSKDLPVFRGPEHDVLSRYYKCAINCNADIVVRITADCPFIDAKLVDSTIDLHLRTKADYTSNNFPPTFPDGFDVEVVSLNALSKAWSKADTPSQREHVTLYFKTNSEFNVQTYRNSVDLSYLRVTLDDTSDYELIKQIYSKFDNPMEVSLDEIVELLKSSPELVKINEGKKYNDGFLMSDGAKLWSRANAVIAGGNQLLSKKPEMFLPELWPTYFSRAKGIKVWDLRGKEFLDMSLMGVGTNILGYGNEIVDQAVSEAVKKGNLSTLNAPEEVYLAESLISRNSWADKVRFARTGGEAASIAVRLGRAASGKHGVAICGYHGWHDWYLAANLNESNSLDKHLLPGLPVNGVPHDLLGTVYPFQYNDLAALETIISHGDIGVIIMEVQRNIAPESGFLDRVRAIAKKNSIVLIFDECSSGFRETQSGLFEKYNVVPDIALYGKTLGNGYAITAVVGIQEVMNYAQQTFISSTFWTERIGFVAGLATLKVFDDVKPWIHVSKLGNYLRKSWISLAEKYKIKINITGIPAMSSFSFDHPDNLLYKTFITQELWRNNILGSNTVYLSTIHNENVIDYYIDVLDPIFKTIAGYNDRQDFSEKLETDVCQSGFKRLN